MLKGEFMPRPVKSGRPNIPNLEMITPTAGIADEFERLGGRKGWFEAYRFLSLACVEEAQRNQLAVWFSEHPGIVANVGAQVEAMIPDYDSPAPRAPRLRRGFWTVLDDFLGQAGLNVTSVASETIEQFFANGPEWPQGLKLPDWQDVLLDPSCHPDDFRWHVERLTDGRLRFVPKQSHAAPPPACADPEARLVR